LIDVDAAAVVVKFAREIEKRALPLGLFPDKMLPQHERAREDAWRMLKKLQRFMNHVEESDLSLLLWAAAKRRGNDREMSRLAQSTRYEDNGYRTVLAELTALLAKIEKHEKADPGAVKYGKEIAEARAKQVANAAAEKERTREVRNARARERRATAKEEAAAATTKAKRSATKKAVTA
jgi:hypothetical protein